RERPLAKNSYVFSARSMRGFESNLLDDLGRPSGLDRPEVLVDMLYKFESVRAKYGYPLPRAPLTPFPEPFETRPGERVVAPATGGNRRRPQRYSINYAWAQRTDSFDAIAEVLSKSTGGDDSEEPAWCASARCLIEWLTS
ncbi:hypothetical protein FOZ63_021658, partial [Perkinsus olseni]